VPQRDPILRKGLHIELRRIHVPFALLLRLSV
jgi:hypothetical protein